MKFLLATSSIVFLVSSVMSIPDYDDDRGLHVQEPLYGYNGPHLPVNSYDDLHKYGGIGRKSHIGNIYDHGAQGFKNYYGDTAYGNHGLNKYSKMLQSDHYGAKKGGQAKFQGGQLYTRNRGYGYEKQYMYDKEYSNSKHDGSHSDFVSNYGDHDKAKQSSLDSAHKYGHNLFGGKSGHDDHAYGKYNHLSQDHKNDYLKHQSHLPHISSPHISSELSPHIGSYAVHQPKYIPMLESYSGHIGGPYGGALGHHHSVTPEYADSTPLLSAQHLPTTEGNAVLYVPSASAAMKSESEGESINTLKASIHNSALPLISTKLTSVTSAPMFTTISKIPRVNSAVHATPAIISTSNGLHYYSS